MVSEKHLSIKPIRKVFNIQSTLVAVCFKSFISLEKRLSEEGNSIESFFHFVEVRRPANESEESSREGRGKYQTGLYSGMQWPGVSHEFAFKRTKN